MKAEADKLDVNKLVNVPTSPNNLETKVDDLDVGKFKTVPVDLKNFRDLVDNEVVKNTKFSTLNTLKTKVNNSDRKISDATTLISTSQYNTDKQNSEKIKMLIKKIPGTKVLVTTTILNTKINKVENKIPNTSNLVIKASWSVINTDFDKKLASFNKRTTSNKTKHLEV